jgi:hypothetical protein
MKMHDFSLLLCTTVELPGLIFPALHVEIMSFKFSVTISLMLLFILHRLYLFVILD